MGSDRPKLPNLAEGDGDEELTPVCPAPSWKILPSRPIPVSIAGEEVPVVETVVAAPKLPRPPLPPFELPVLPRLELVPPPLAIASIVPGGRWATFWLCFREWLSGIWRAFWSWPS